MGLDVSLIGLALAAAEDVAVVLTGIVELCCICIRTSISFNRIATGVPWAHVVLARDADTAAMDIDGGLAGVGSIGERVRPADVERMLNVMSVSRRSGNMLDGVGDGAHRGQFATAIDALLDPGAVANGDVGVAFHEGGPLHGLDIDFLLFSTCGIGDDKVTICVEAFVAVAAAIQVAPDGAALHRDVGVGLHRAELAAAIHIAFDDGIAVDGQVGFLHLAQVGPQGVDGGVVKVFESAHGAGKHVAARGVLAEIGVINRLVVVTDGAARDVDGDMAVRLGFIIIKQLAIPWISGCNEPGAHRGQTTAAVDGAEHGAAADGHIDVAYHHACGEGVAREATTAAKHVAIHVGTAPSADEGGLALSLTHIHCHIAKHVAVFAAAKDGAEDGAARDAHFHFAHVGPSVELGAGVAHACAEEVAGDGVRGNGFQGARHTQGAAAHLDGAFAFHVGNLIAAIDGSEDVASRDFNMGVAVHLTSRATPHAGRNGIVARAAAKHVAEERVAVGALQGCGIIVGIVLNIIRVIRVFLRISKDVVNIIRGREGPGIALVELSGCSINIGFNARLHRCDGIIPCIFCIRLIKRAFPNAVDQFL